MRTSDPFIYAVGMRWRRQISSPANLKADPAGGSCQPAGHTPPTTCWAVRKPQRRPRAPPSASCSTWRWPAQASTRSVAGAAGSAVREGLCPPGSHAGYCPGAHPVSLKLLFSPRWQDLWRPGHRQAMGSTSASTCWRWLQRAGLTVFDSDLELTYAPPFGSARM